MSASDKKKQRKDMAGAGLTQRELKDLAEAEAQKEKLAEACKPLLA